MNVLFLSFANSREQPLPSLQQEEEGIYKTLSTRALKQHFLLHRDAYATLARISEYLVLYRDHITIFHYSGHAGRDRLLLAEEETAHAGGIAHLLGQCPRLKLAVLNGCSTQGQVQRLLDAGVPVVIATSAPVEDEKASRFGQRFYQGLESQLSIGEAFEMAAGEVLAADSSISIRRQLGFREAKEGPLWGIFYKEEQAGLLDEKLPAHIPPVLPEDFQPNRRLTAGLWDILAPYSKKIRLQKMMEEEGDAIEEGDKHVAILNSLPRPVAEHLRKLMAPVEAEKEGYDKVSEARLRQIAQAYEATMEFLAYILLAQLWEARFEAEAPPPPEPLLELIRRFLALQRAERAGYDFEPLLLALHEALEEQGVPFFVSELERLRQFFREEEGFRDACFFMNVLRKKLEQDAVAPYELADMCIRGEESLLALFRQLGFLAKYTLAAVKHIDVLHYRHLKDTRFSHAMVKLMRVFGKLQEEQFIINRFLFNRSVLLLKEEEENGQPSTRELSLAPFIIDENAFELKTDLSKLYFFSHYKAGSDSYCYKHINRPGDPLLEVSAGKYELVKAQFDTFREMLALG